MNISIASDHAGFEQKQELAAYLRELGHQVADLGPETDDRVDYPDFAALVARDVACSCAARASAWPWPPTRCAASAPPT